MWSGLHVANRHLSPHNYTPYILHLDSWKYLLSFLKSTILFKFNKFYTGKIKVVKSLSKSSNVQTKKSNTIFYKKVIKDLWIWKIGGSSFVLASNNSDIYFLLATRTKPPKRIFCKNSLPSASSSFAPLLDLQCITSVSLPSYPLLSLVSLYPLTLQLFSSRPWNLHVRLCEY